MDTMTSELTGADLDALEDDDDLLPDDLAPVAKGAAKPLVRSKTVTKNTVAAEAKLKAKQAADAQALAAKANAAQLAQIVNLHIAGISLEEIGASIGRTADEVDRMLQSDVQRYVRSQPALRVFVRNYISSKYSDLLDAVWDEATDKNHEEKLENLREARAILKDMGRLHGAEAPVQTEVKVDAAPESIDRMVAALAAQAGRAYDMEIFDDDEDEDIIDAELVGETSASDLQVATQKALTVSGNRIDVEAEESGEDDEF